MKILIDLSANTEPVPFNYLHELCGIFHYWIGPNDLHNTLSLYSIGWLKGGRMKTFSRSASEGNEIKGLDFPNGAQWEIGVYHDEIAERLVRGLLLKPPVFHGMQVKHVRRLQPPTFEHPKFNFKAGSPIVIRKRDDATGTRDFLRYNDPESTMALKRVMDKKLSTAGKGDLVNDYAIYFDQSYARAKTKMIRIKKTNNIGNVCPVIVIGNKEVKHFAWQVGAGDLTGVGFGSLSV